MRGTVEKGATLSKDKVYRYSLWRCWNPAGSLVSFCMLNPSTADENVDDPTIRRCIRFAKEWGYGGMIVVNCFAYRATDPKQLYTAVDPVGEWNDYYIEKARDASEFVCAAWGVHGGYRQRGEFVKRHLIGEKAQCLGLTKAGEPKHPLYLSAKSKPFSFVY